MSTSPDILDAALAIGSDTSLSKLRQSRAKAAVATQGCYDDLLGPGVSDDQGLELADRLLVAFDISRAAGVQALIDHYAQRLVALPLSASQQAAVATVDAISGDARLDAILRFSRGVAQQPYTTGQPAVQALTAVGLLPQDIVTLGQLVGFVAYQVRLAAGLQALRDVLDSEQGAGATAASEHDPAFVHPANLPGPGEPIRANGFTSETLNWKAWLPVVDVEHATQAQHEVLTASHPKARTSEFYLLLAHQPGILAVRSAAFNAIMYAPGGLARADREVVTTIVSRINRCVYCASVHAQRYEQLTKQNAFILQVFEAPEMAGGTARERALVSATIALTAMPGSFDSAALKPLRDAGLSDIEMLDALHAGALFAWANRLMLNLGEAVYPVA
jgi:uncharacterized peroxidase-related enzyme